MSKKSWWPVWFPYPIAWLRTLMLLGVQTLLVGLVRVAGVWGVILSAIGGDANFTALSILITLALLLPFILTAYLHHFLFGKSPAKWPKALPSPSSLREGGTALAVFLFAWIIDIVLILPFALECSSPACENYEILINTAVGLWILTATYLYHWDYLIRQKRQERNNSAKKS